jgi:hypothetical protein
VTLLFRQKKHRHIRRAVQPRPHAHPPLRRPQQPR